MYSKEQIETAQKRLRDDPTLTSTVVARLKSSQEEARSTLDAAKLDSEFQRAMAEITHLFGAEQLLTAEYWQAHFEERAEEARVEEERLTKAALVAGADLRNAIMRQGNGPGWSGRIALENGLKTLQHRVKCLAERAAGVTDEIALRSVIDDCADVLTSAKSSLALEQRESLRRQSAAAAA